MNRRQLLLGTAAALVGSKPPMMADPRLDLFAILGATNAPADTAFEKYTTWFHDCDLAGNPLLGALRAGGIVTFPDDFTNAQPSEVRQSDQKNDPAYLPGLTQSCEQTTFYYGNPDLPPGGLPGLLGKAS